MITNFFSALQLEFMQNAIMAGFLVSIACGIIGTFVVVNRIVFISGGIAHSAYGGIGLGYFFGFNPIIGAIAFSLLSGFGMAIVERNTGERKDTIIGTMWAMGMSIGIIFIDLTKGYKANLMSYLFGSILAVPKQDLWIMLILDVVIITMVCLFYKELLAISFDPMFATTRNLPVNSLYLMLVGAIALTIVMVMQVVGLIMIIALLTIPAAVANQYVQEMKQMMILSSILGVIFILLGLSLSFIFNLTSGATIIMVAGCVYFLSLIIKQWQLKSNYTR
ncbi:metal ABC transporter permease [Cyanobacterium sp. Dongsha4]|uniref:metal ABC transporter permease n=1 Tax=Cyanobacterium sp. DS4 TaxID=2878255 RepID=UPI002E81B7BA|nr:metal ABC transporter permease [Cyanobacterium sp. Dongsha4]WVK99210.1 metal ABC transporter permease [Cyanobacterium sp. Dongsha4]